METEREKNEFDRMVAAQELEKARHLVGQYVHHQAFWRGKIEESLYALGRLDERLGGPK